VTVHVGHIKFLNCHPLYYGLEQRGMLTSSRGGASAEGRAFAGTSNLFELIPGVPTDLNRMLAEGAIDLGPVSSIAYARDHRRLLLSRHLSISSFGAVDSIQVISRMRLEDVRSVSLTRQSATSVALLKTILKLRYGVEVTYDILNSPVGEALRDHDAVLLIGDQALDALCFPEPETVCYDLGRIWQEWTGLPMVYAVWAARENFARSHGAELLTVEDELVKCMDYGRERLDDVVESALSRTRLERAALAHYFDILDYDFPPVYQRGLRRFYELAHEAGELAEVPEMRFIDEVAVQ
jgi:chorismate dehydratase